MISSEVRRPAVERVAGQEGIIEHHLDAARVHACDSALLVHTCAPVSTLFAMDSDHASRWT